MEASTFEYTITPDPGGWSWSWSLGNTVAMGTHDPFSPFTTYMFTVTAAEDMAGNPLAPIGPAPNPWTFTTGSDDPVPPNITATIPIDSALGVAVNQSVEITFSEPINTTTFDYMITPDPGGWTWIWSMGDTVVTGIHTNFAAFTPHTFTVIAAEDLAGNPLDTGPVPNPWDWMTGEPDTTPPNITTTTPLNASTGIALDQDIVITFSEAINTTTLASTCVPDPGGWSWSWSGYNTVATGTHTDFAGSTSYTFTVTAADDIGGNPLAAGPVPNPWSWTSAGKGNVKGKVVDEEGDLIENAEVKLYDSGDNPISTEESDSSGEFTFTGVDEGTNYYLVVTKDGYKSKTKSDVDVTTGATENVGNITLETDGTVSGKVVDEDGNPIKDATVKLLDAEGNVLETTTTDSDGEYKFEDLDYGTYKLQMSAPGYGEETTGSFTLDKDNLNEARPDVALAPTAGPMDWWLLIVIIVIIVVILIIVALMLAKRKRKPTAIPQQPPDSPHAQPPPPSTAPPPPSPP